MDTEILSLIRHLTELAEGIVRFDEAAQIYWKEAGQVDDDYAIKDVNEAYDNINKRMVMTQDSIGRVLRQYGQRGGELSRILNADDEFNKNNK